MSFASKQVSGEHHTSMRRSIFAVGTVHPANGTIRDGLNLRHLKMPMKNGGGDSYVIPSSVPAFLVKLWKLVEDPQYDEHISWNKNGTGFLVHDQATFAREVLPKYFKHNNFASFVRQLNMYGFRKVIGAEQGGLRSDKDEWEFFNQNFQQGQPELLEHVKRKAAPDERKMKSEDVAKVLNDVQSMKGKQDEMTQRLELIRRENESLWQELVDLRQKHQRQQQIVNKLFQCLMRLVYQNERIANKRSQLMLQDSSEGDSPPKRQRTSYGDAPRSGPSSGQLPAYSQGPSTQTLTISDISNQPTHSGMPASTGSSTGGPLITALPDDDVSRPGGTPSSHTMADSSSGKPIISSPTMATTGPSYPHASVLHQGISTGVVTFPEEPAHPAVVHPTHIMEPTQYTVPSRERRATGPIRQYSEEEIYEQKPRNHLGEHVDYISANLEALQHALQSNQGLLDGNSLSDIFGQEGGFMQQQMPQSFNMDFLESLGGVPSPLPGSLGGAPHQGNELIQYGNQGSGNSASLQRPSRSPQYGRGDWTQANKQDEYDVNNLFNG